MKDYIKERNRVEEEDFDERVHTPSDYDLTEDEKIQEEEEIDDEETMDEEEDDEVTKELYDDVNSRFEQEEEDAHVTLTPVLDTQKTGDYYLTRPHEEEDFDERVHTPSDYDLTEDEKIQEEEEIDDEETMDEEEDDEVTKELYDDVNVNLGNEDTEITIAD
nr:hypothetical protein [Tanacetum cinerariifolium]